MLIAADTNVLLDLAQDVEAVVDAVATIRERLPNDRMVVPPTVLQELALAVRMGGAERIRKTAFRALSELRAWGFEPLNLVPSVMASSSASRKKSGARICSLRRR